MAATAQDSRGGQLYGPRGFGNLGGPPAEQRLYPTLTSAEEARRVWQVSERLTAVSVTA
ncbi:hypothetical protein [Pseudonocardia broussonetiae]|uniref:hypothetical protein n=1 Tax=Pseudonocardia broussonetiae TaxID=2736640 RepID=UPI001F039572|nr:hypothetical protein [Pseudonocardia broussonetiae]